MGSSSTHESTSRPRRLRLFLVSTLVASSILCGGAFAFSSYDDLAYANYEASEELRSADGSFGMGTWTRWLTKKKRWFWLPGSDYLEFDISKQEFSSLKESGYDNAWDSLGGTTLFLQDAARVAFLEEAGLDSSGNPLRQPRK